MTNTLKYLGLIILSFVIGFLIRSYFFEFSFSQIATDNVEFVSRTLGGQFYSHILFALSIGIIPLLYLITKKVAKLNFMKQGLISCGIIIISGIIFWQLRLFQLKTKYQELSEYDIGNGIEVAINSADLNFENYLFIGFLIGTVASILIYKYKNKKVTD